MAIAATTAMIAITSISSTRLNAPSRMARRSSRMENGKWQVANGRAESFFHLPFSIFHPLVAGVERAFRIGLDRTRVDRVCLDVAAIHDGTLTANVPTTQQPPDP